MTLRVISSGNNNNIKCLFFNKLWGQIDHELKIDHEGVSPSKDKRTDPAAVCRSDIRGQICAHRSKIYLS